MIIDVEIGGRRRRVELERNDGHAAIDGRALTVDATPIAGGWSLLVDGKSYDVAVDGGRDGELTVHLNGHAIAARLIDPRAFVRRGHGGHGASSGTRQVAAPMPGHVVKVLVKPGDQVTADQGLVVVEAMKMENELRAPGDGTVREVRAVEGTSVEAGAILVVLE